MREPLTADWSGLPKALVDMKALQFLGSLKLTAAILVLLGIAVVLGFYDHLPMSWALAVPLLLFAVNLAAAIATQPVFRRQTWLLVFHLALLALILLAAFSRLTYLKGGVEVSTGDSFDGTLTRVETGPLHPWHIRDLSFRNEGFEVNFQAPRRRDKTYNRISWETDEGPRRAVVGDNHPLVLEGYRFYPSPNNGFAPVFRWQSLDGQNSIGSVHLPAYPILELQQSQEWDLPDGRTRIWVLLDFDQPLIAADRPSVLQPPDPHRLIVRIGERREIMQPGDRIRLDNGALQYVGLNTWMGYVVYYDRAIPWMLAAGAVAVLSLGWHFLIKFRGRPWQAESRTL